MKKYGIRFLSVSLCFLTFISCNLFSAAETAEPTTSVTVNGTEVLLSFDFALQIDSVKNTFDTEFNYPKTYTTSFFIDPSQVNDAGHIAVHAPAQDFPKMIFRVCQIDSNTNDCDMYYDPNEIDDIDLQGNEIDVVIDACTVDDAQCGNSDTGIFTGTLTPTGSLVLNNLEFRVRFFFADGDVNGLNATSSATGLDVNGGEGTSSLRINVSRLTTGKVSINGGDNISEVGSSVNGSNLTLVGAGVIPSSIPGIGGSYFIGKIFAETQTDLLTFFE